MEASSLFSQSAMDLATEVEAMLASMVRDVASQAFFINPSIFLSIGSDSWEVSSKGKRVFLATFAIWMSTFGVSLYRRTSSVANASRFRISLGTVILFSGSCHSSVITCCSVWLTGNMIFLLDRRPPNISSWIVLGGLSSSICIVSLTALMRCTMSLDEK
ncbi:hypothetical protein GDO78_017898 [Eleutherodactylus coqui]|uniref:Uncharacterized protein n=1 Tax=Eleutherodactylus coqui TaxID=57060 RepID=A0A8J6E3C9_ELECQ|nr:hypothetical protein GDO78_017898 [Eleutherodactylus coqui]